MSGSHLGLPSCPKPGEIEQVSQYIVQLDFNIFSIGDSTPSLETQGICSNAS